MTAVTSATGIRVWGREVTVTWRRSGQSTRYISRSHRLVRQMVELERGAGKEAALAMVGQMRELHNAMQEQLLQLKAAVVNDVLRGNEAGQGNG